MDWMCLLVGAAVALGVVACIVLVWIFVKAYRNLNRFLRCEYPKPTQLAELRVEPRVGYVGGKCYHVGCMCKQDGQDVQPDKCGTCGH